MWRAIVDVGPVALPCCTYVERVCARAYGPTVVAVGGTQLWNLWHPDADPWGPVTAAVLSGVAIHATDPVPGAWHLAQGWRTEPSHDGSGHTFFLFAGLDGRCVVVDATDKRAAAMRWTTRAALARDFGHGLRFARLRRPPGE